MKIQRNPCYLTSLGNYVLVCQLFPWLSFDVIEVDDDDDDILQFVLAITVNHFAYEIDYLGGQYQKDWKCICA